MRFFNGLTPPELERLAIISEEMGEAQQAIGKILRHGYDSHNPDIAGGDDNRADLQRELGDVMYAMSLLADGGDVDHIAVCEQALYKAGKIKPFLHHQGDPDGR